MKKILIGLLLCLSSLMFADAFKGGEKIAEIFFMKGTYIKIENITDTTYIYKTSITSITIDSTEFHIGFSGYNAMTGKDNNEQEVNIHKFNIENDADGNIIITRKK